MPARTPTLILILILILIPRLESRITITIKIKIRIRGGLHGPVALCHAPRPDGSIKIVLPEA